MYNTFSLILATKNRVTEVAEFLESIKALNYDKEMINIIIVDQNKNNELDNIVSKYSDLNIQHIKSNIEGLSQNRNIGLKYANGDIVAFPDDDCEYLSSTLETVNHIFNSHNDIGVVMGRIVERDDSDSLRKWPKEEINITTRNFYTKCSSITIFSRNDAAAHGFDEKLGVGNIFGSCEDSDYLYRKLKAGIKIRYFPEIKVFHPHYDAKGNMSLSKVYNYGLGFGAFARKNLDLDTFVLFLKANTYHLLKMLLSILTFNKKLAIKSLYAFKGRIVGFYKYKK